MGLPLPPVGEEKRRHVCSVPSLFDFMEMNPIPVLNWLAPIPPPPRRQGGLGPGRRETGSPIQGGTREQKPGKEMALWP